MAGIYHKVREFKTKYPMTVSWRLKKHCEVAELHLNPDEEVVYAFAAQKNDNPIDIITSAVIVLTNKRIIIAQKRLVFGYLFKSITPDMFNDLNVNMGLIWSEVYIDTVKEFVCLSNIQREALPIIETAVTEYMMKEKSKLREQEHM